MRHNLMRRFSSSFAVLAMYTLTVLALVPLGLVLWFTIVKGLPAVTSLEFFVNSQRPSGIPGSGIANAIVGSAIIVGLASIAAIPIGVLSGVYLAEYGSGRWASCESAVGLIPNGLRESGLALGLPRWRVSLQLILPAAAPGVITGALLAVARAAGETAPVLFTALGNQRLTFDAGHPMSTLPLVVFRDALTPYKDLQQEAWGAALVLVVMVLVINLGSRWVLRRQIALARQL